MGSGYLCFKVDECQTHALTLQDREPIINYNYTMNFTVITTFKLAVGLVKLGLCIDWTN